VVGMKRILHCETMILAALAALALAAPAIAA
jgi:hypothetical protein